MVLLVRLGLNSLFGWSWAGPVAGLVIAGVAVREGLGAADSCCSPAAGPPPRPEQIVNGQSSTLSTRQIMPADEQRRHRSRQGSSVGTGWAVKAPSGQFGEPRQCALEGGEHVGPAAAEPDGAAVAELMGVQQGGES